jgi:glycosyltransferase involved in cell wall biosynthesis
VPDRPAIAGAEARWCAREGGASAAIVEARRWAPDVVFAQGFESLPFERAVVGLGPAVLFAHAYAGLCVSGSRTWQSSNTACTRSLGPGCLLHYFPHRCGGRSPATMLREYARQRARRELHRSYKAIVVASHYMASLMASSAGPVHVLPPPVPPPVRTVPRLPGSPIRFVYAGRLEPLKGVHLLIDATREAARRLHAEVELHVAGDGPSRVALEAGARAVDGQIEVTFEGWREPASRDELFASSDLLLVPSLWPEPYGLVGMEAARFGVPAAAFASGGIPEWLHDGVTGVIAPARTAHGLAGAAVAAVSDACAYRQLSSGALAAAAAASVEAHAAGLERVFEESLA